MSSTPLERFIDVLDINVRRVLLVLATLVSIIVLVSIFARYVLNSSISWSDEISRAMLTWLIFLGASSALKANEMASMEAMRDGLSDRSVLSIRLVCDLLVLGLLGVIIYGSVELIALTARQTFPVTGLPMWIAYAAIPTGSALMVIYTVARSIRLINGSEPLRQTHAADEIG